MVELEAKRRMFIYGKGYVYLVPLPRGDKELLGEDVKISYKELTIEGKVRVYDKDSYCFAPLIVGVFISNDKCSECNEEADAEHRSSFYNLCLPCKKSLDEAWYGNQKAIDCLELDKETGGFKPSTCYAPNIRTWFKSVGFPRKNKGSATDVIEV